MSKIDLSPLINGRYAPNEADNLLIYYGSTDNDPQSLEETELLSRMTPEETDWFFKIARTYLAMRLNPNVDEKVAVHFFNSETARRWEPSEKSRRQADRSRILSKLHSSFVGFGMIGSATPETTIVPDNTYTPGVNESKRVSWDLQRYGIGIQKTWPVKKLEAFPYLRYGWQASFTVFDGSMDYEGKEVAHVEGQSLATSLLAGLEYPFNDTVSVRLLGSFGAEVGRFATTLNGLGGIPDKCSAPTGIPTTSQVVDAASCELANMLATYYSFPTMLTGGVKLYDTFHFDLSWQNQYLNNSPYVYSPEGLNTWWLTFGVDTD